MIRIRELEIEKNPLYSPDGELIGYMDYPQFLDVRIQIKEKGLSGYYVLFTDSNNVERKIFINPDGSTDSYPIGFYDLIDNQIDILLDLV